MSADNMVVMGQFGAPFGIRGWVHVFADTQYPDSLLEYPLWYIGKPGEWMPCKVETTELHPKSLVVKLEGVDDRDAAALLRNTQIAVPRNELPNPDDGEYYWSDLVGLSVINQQGESLGKVTSLLETGAHDVLVVQGDDAERLLPFVGHVVLDVDVASGRITVDWGLDY